MTNIEEIIGEAKPPERTATICTRGDLQAEHERLELIVATAKVPAVAETVGGNSEAIAAAERQQELRALMRSHERTFTFRALDPLAWADLRGESPSGKDLPPTEQFRLAYEYAVKVVAACCIDPKMSQEQAGRLLSVISEGQRNKLFSTAWAVNIGDVDIPFSVRGSVLAPPTDET